jgi:hypothetical protein
MGRPARGVILALLPLLLTAQAARLLRQDVGPAQPVSLINGQPNGSQGVPYQPNNGGWSGNQGSWSNSGSGNWGGSGGSDWSNSNNGGNQGWGGGGSQACT